MRDAAVIRAAITGRRMAVREHRQEQETCRIEPAEQVSDWPLEQLADAADNKQDYLVPQALRRYTRPARGGRSRYGATPHRTGAYELAGGLLDAVCVGKQGERQFRPRARQGCDHWFEVAPSAGRVDKMYCSGACHARAYRARKAGQIYPN
jgi:hypothetical protein